MTLDFDKLPRFKHEAIKILSLVSQWAFALKVPEDAVVQQVYTAHAWANSNPKKAPKKNVTRFLDSWMKSAQRWGNLRVSTPSIPRAPEKEPEMSYDEMVAIRKANMAKAHV